MVIKLWSECKLVFSVTFVCLPPMVTRRPGMFGGLMSPCIPSITAEAESAGCCLTGQRWMMTPWRYHTPDEAWRRCSLLHHITASIGRDGEEGWLLLQTRLLFVFTCWYMLELHRTGHSCSTQQCHRVGKNCQGRINAVTGNRRCVSITVLICSPTGGGQLGERWEENFLFICFFFFL